MSSGKLFATDVVVETSLSLWIFVVFVHWLAMTQLGTIYLPFLFYQIIGISRIMVCLLLPSNSRVQSCQIILIGQPCRHMIAPSSARVMKIMIDIGPVWESSRIRVDEFSCLAEYVLNFSLVIP
jgi:hypothetical protein